MHHENFKKYSNFMLLIRPHAHAYPTCTFAGPVTVYYLSTTKNPFLKYLDPPLFRAGLEMNGNMKVFKIQPS